MCGVYEADFYNYALDIFREVSIVKVGDLLDIYDKCLTG